MKRILTGIALCFQLLNAENIELNKDLADNIYETIDMVYANTNQLRKTSLYLYVSKNPDIEMVITADSSDPKRSKFTLLSMKYSGNSRRISTTDRILTLVIDRNGQISINENIEVLLTKKEILEKQNLIFQLVSNYKSQLKEKVEYDQKELDIQKDKFMKMNLK